MTASLHVFTVSPRSSQPATYWERITSMISWSERHGFSGVLIFTGLTAYDVQKISRMAADPQIAGQGPELMRKLSIMGALALYLDFLNLFYYLLRLFGRNR